jgi:uncharacterized protein
MEVRFEILARAEDLGREHWNWLAMDASPMMEWEYFYALEQSGAVSVERGYRPMHLVAYTEGGQAPVAVAPLYERDRAWVEFGDGGLIEFLTELTGIPFNHGLVGAVPFTPVPAYRILLGADTDHVGLTQSILSHIDLLCETHGLATSRFYFLDSQADALRDQLIQQGYIGLKSEYCLWFNKDYHGFEDYLSTFRSSRRTKIRRELRSIEQMGVEIGMVRGLDAPPVFFDDLYTLYQRTWIKHMGLRIRPFLNETFFRLLYVHFRHRCSFSVARLDAERIGMALFYGKGETLFGRYWGCFEETPFLHFATCYYKPIIHAIERGIRVMDPGFGGEHKLIRGYEVVPVHHYIKFHGESQRRIAMSVLNQMGLAPAEGSPKP